MASTNYGMLSKIEKVYIDLSSGLAEEEIHIFRSREDANKYLENM